MSYFLCKIAAILDKISYIARVFAGAFRAVVPWWRPRAGTGRMGISFGPLR
ncbi:Hypothetical protein FKW44_025061 [Caligus rogercresseyi]|uniref:Uncharacterized protein n=1 Tax=Caligus rogercresseyi TaxID=217165 RepID=A0A7T8JSV7_CALRO|nr:Hypothetical protein FKW44_025061 [Caligus rogercresseyi]